MKCGFSFGLLFKTYFRLWVIIMYFNEMTRYDCKQFDFVESSSILLNGGHSLF